MISFRLNLCVLALCALAGVSHAQATADKRADELLTRGQKLFAEGNYPEAIDKLRAGYVMSPQPRFLYALGQAYRFNHQCKEAVKAYRDFIRSEPSRGQVSAAESNIQRCGEEDPSSLVEPAPVKVEPVVTPVVTPVVVPIVVAEPPLRRKPPVYKKWWLWTTVGVVAVGVGVGVGLGLGLRSGSKFDATLPSLGPGASMAIGIAR